MGSRGWGRRCVHTGGGGRGVTAATQGQGSGAPEQGSQGRTGLRVEAGRCPGRGSSLKSHQVPARDQAASHGPQGGGTPLSPDVAAPAGGSYQQRPRCLVLRPLTSLTPGMQTCWQEVPQLLGGSPSVHAGEGEGAAGPAAGAPRCKLGPHGKLATSAGRGRPAVLPQRQHPSSSYVFIKRHFF